MKFLGSAKLTPKCQIVIPKKVRTLLKLKGGDDIVFAQDEEGLIYLTKDIELVIPKKEE